MQNRLMRIAKRRGFTLIEVVTSTLVITVLAAGLFGAFVGARYFFNLSRHKLQAMNFAREALETLKGNFTYSASQLNVGNHTESEIGSIIRGEMTNLSTSLTYDVSQPEAGGYKKVTVRVQWNEVSLF